MTLYLASSKKGLSLWSTFHLAEKELLNENGFSEHYSRFTKFDESTSTLTCPADVPGHPTIILGTIVTLQLDNHPLTVAERGVW